MTFDYSEVMQKLSEPLRKKVEHSIDILRKAERLALAYDEENGYYLAFSGGKDSQCLYHVAKLAGVKLKAHMSLTSVDPPGLSGSSRGNIPMWSLSSQRKASSSVPSKSRYCLLCVCVGVAGNTKRVPVQGR